MGPGLTQNFFLQKSSKNSPKPVLIFWSSMPYMYSVCTFLKVVGYYDLSVLFNFSDWFPEKKVWMGGGWVG